MNFTIDWQGFNKAEIDYVTDGGLYVCTLSSATKRDSNIGFTDDTLPFTITAVANDILNGNVNLDSYLVADLDEYAELMEIEGYPPSATKAVKLAFLKGLEADKQTAILGALGL